MKKKIVILGALGYIGTELSKIYSGESWSNNIIGIDNRFVSERVTQLKDWNIKFHQGEILDLEFLKTHISDADVIHHLAGVTDVAYVSKESNPEQDEKIRKVAVEGTNNILKLMKDDCKIIFPSTHVIYEGLKSTKIDIKENETPKPILMYSTSKVQNENDIKKSNKNYVILRLGSVHGYSLDSMRINIMPNLFSKIASQNGIIKLFSGGKQIKSLVPLMDVVRCMKFMEEKNQIKKETFNLVKEVVTVKQVAEICKKFNPKVTLKISDDETPNLGYTLSNKKLLKTGFKFIYNLDESISSMINHWSSKIDKNHLEHIFKGQNEFVDKRGKISNYELPEPINLIGYIESKKGTIRANHYHPVQEQKCLLIKGQFISIYKDLLNDKSPKITHTVNEGDLIVTKPNVAHAMVFTKDSIFLNLVRGEREHENYGITHTIPMELINEKEKDFLISIYKLKCRCCGSRKLKRVISLGYQPLANNLNNKINQKQELYPLEMNVCEECFNCQLSVAVKSEKMFSNYLYQSSTTKSFKNHFIEAADKYIKTYKLKNKNSYIVDIGSNDGIALKPFKEKGFKKILGIEPAKNLSKLANKNGIKTYNAYLNKKILKKIKKGADLVLASNVFAHADDLKSMAECMKEIIKPKGTIIIEVQYLMNTLKDLTFDNIYHEHTNYWSLTSLNKFFDNLKCKIFNVEKINTHGGSLRIYISKNMNIKCNKSVKNLLIEEEKFGIKNISTYLNFGKKIIALKKKVNQNMSNLKKKYSKIVAYGSPAKATTALNFFNISNEIKYIIEDNKMKHGKFLPGVNIPIKSKKKDTKNLPCVIVLAWNFFDEIKSNNPELSNNFISIKELEYKKL